MSEFDKEENSVQNLRVFISYSRGDIEFVRELRIALEHYGFEVLIDNKSIHPGEDWQKRLGHLIRNCERIVFVLTNKSAQSRMCLWEAKYAVEQSKSIMVAVPGLLDTNILPPEPLAKLHWVTCWSDPQQDGSSFMGGIVELDKALRTDIGWLRQETEYQELALKWAERGRPVDSPFLLQGELIKIAEEWLWSTPSDLNVSDLVALFIKVSRQAEANRKAEALAHLQERKEALVKAERASGRVRLIGFIGAGVAMVLFVSASTIGSWGWRNLEAANNLSVVAADLERTAARRVALFLKEDFPVEKDLKAKALLLALQSDPSASRNEIRSRFHGADAYPQSRQQLITNFLSKRLQHIYDVHEKSIVHLERISKNKIMTASVDGYWQLSDIETGKIVKRNYSKGGSIRSVYFIDTGRFILGTDDGIIRYWDIESEKILKEYSGHGDWILSLKRILENNFVSGSFDGELILWEFSSEKYLDKVDTGRPIRVIEIFGQDGFLVGYADGSIDYFDFTLRKIDEWRNLKERPIIGLQQVDESRFIFATNDGDVDLFNVSTGVVERSLAAFGVGVVQIKTASNGYIMVALNNGSLYKIDPEALDLVEISSESDVKITSAEVFSDQDIFLGADDGAVYQIKERAIKPDQDLKFPSLGRSLAISDLGVVAFGNENGLVSLWDISKGHTILELPNHGAQVTSATFLSGDLLLTGSQDGTARLWDLSKEKDNQLQVFFDKHEKEPMSAAVESVAYSDTGIAAAGLNDGRVRIWSDGVGDDPIEYSLHSSTVQSVMIGDDGTIMTGDNNGHVKFWNMSNGELVDSFDVGSIMITPIIKTVDGRLLTGSIDRIARLWDTETLKSIAEFHGHREWILAIDAHPAGLLATAARDGVIKIWDFKGFELLSLNTYDQPIRAIKFLDDYRLVAVSDSGKILDWSFPPLLFETDPREQVRISCEWLNKANAPLWFSSSDIERIPVLDGEPFDEETQTFVSPCRCHLPDDEFYSEGNRCPEGLPVRVE